MKNLSLFLISLILLIHNVSAEEVKKTDAAKVAFQAKLKKMAGPLGPFAAHESFPKGYFLISNNLPSMVGLTLNHPMSYKLKLTDSQRTAILKVKSLTIPVVVPAAKEIKILELELADRVIKNEELASLSALVDRIAALQAKLTKKHLVCIKHVRDILTEDQYKILLGYVGKVK